MDGDHGRVVERAGELAELQVVGGLSDHESMTAASQAKQAIRERVWSELERIGVAEPGVRGYIPAFDGAAQAAGRLAGLPIWQQAHTLEVAPDRAQLPVRIRALHDGKLLYMAAPIADIMGHRDKTTFERIYRHRLRPEIREAADLMDAIWGDAA